MNTFFVVIGKMQELIRSIGRNKGQDIMLKEGLRDNPQDSTSTPIKPYVFSLRSYLYLDLYILFLVCACILPISTQALSPCTSSEAFDLFDFDAWEEQYHGDVRDAVDEYLGQLGLREEDAEDAQDAEDAEEQETSFDSAQDDNNAQQKLLQCTGGTTGVLQPASPTLRSIASRLPEWSEVSNLSQSQFPAVLLAYTNAYECALTDYKMTYTFHTFRELGARGGILALFDLSDLWSQATARREKIDAELRTVRPAMDRTLTALHGLNRLSEFSSSMECLLAASLDLRNVTALLAETASCLPRVWDQRAVLRDISS